MNQPLWPAVSAGRLVLPSLSVSLRPADSSRTDSHASDTSACGPWGATRRRDSCSERTSGCGWACAALELHPSSSSPRQCLQHIPRGGDLGGSHPPVSLYPLYWTFISRSHEPTLLIICKLDIFQLRKQRKALVETAGKSFEIVSHSAVLVNLAVCWKEPLTWLASG